MFLIRLWCSKIQMRECHFGNVVVLDSLLVCTAIKHSKFVQLFFTYHFCTYWLKD
jgi:hypothetical protein